MEIRPIAHMRSDFKTKFGVPRQSGLAPSLKSVIVFEREFRSPEALRGIEKFSHLWLIWNFSGNDGKWGFTVRPPRLGGDVRLGVFATRSPFRPNGLGLSCVRLLGLRETAAEGTVLDVAGADLMNGTPIYDIKPYIPYADCIPEAAGGFTDSVGMPVLEVDFPPELLCKIPENKRSGLIEALSQNPRPAFHHDPQRVYGLEFAGFEIRFSIDASRLKVCDVFAI